MKRIEDKFCSIADSIRKRKGTTEPIGCCDFEKEILSIGDGTVEVIPDGYVHVEGTKSIIENGKHDVTNYMYVQVDVPVGEKIPEGSLVPEGTKVVTANGTYDIKEYADLTVNVPIPEGYILPTGTKFITGNGTYEIEEFDKVTVNVPIPDGYVLPSGTKVITANGTHYVDSFSIVQVNVPIPTGYVIPAGTKQVTTNGTHDVKEFANVTVAVPSDAKIEQIKAVSPTKEAQTVLPDNPDLQTLEKVIVNPIPDEYVAVSGGMTIDENGDYNVRSLATVKVDVKSNQAPAKTELTKTISPTKETRVVTADDPTTQTLSQVTVLPIPDEYIKPTGTLDAVNNNFTYDVKNYEYVDVKVPVTEYSEPKLQEKTVTELDSLSNTTVTPDTGYDGLSKVNINLGTSGLVKPSGTLEVTEVGKHYVAGKEYVNITHPDTLDITSNGTHNVNNYGSVNVNIPGEACTINTSGVTVVPVPNTGYVEKIFFNTELSVDEVVSILSNLNYYQTPFMDYPLYPILFSSDGTPVVFAVKATISSTEVYEINIAYDMANMVYDRIFLSYTSGDGSTAGWHKSECEINKEVINVYSGLAIGHDNSSITNLVWTLEELEGESITLSGNYKGVMLDVTNNGIYDVKELCFDNNEVPSKLNINIPTVQGIKLNPILPEGFSYKFKGIYTAPNSSANNSQYTLNEKLTGMVRELYMVADIDTSTMKIMNSSYVRFREYTSDLTFNNKGDYVTEFSMDGIYTLIKSTLYIPADMITELLKEYCVQYRFELVTSGNNGTAMYMALDSSYGPFESILGGYHPITIKQGLISVNDSIYATELIYSE